MPIMLNTGPTYVDVTIPAGKYLTAFGPAPKTAGRGSAPIAVAKTQFVDLFDIGSTEEQPLPPQSTTSIATKIH
jgi:hypothetical protein